MTGVSVVPPGFAPLRRRLAGLTTAARGEVSAAFQAIATDVVTQARQSLSGSATGGEPSSPSAPGGPPDDPTGRLAASLRAEVDPHGPLATVGAAASYAIHLEYGTRHMAPRPFLRPAVDATRGTAREHLRAALARAAARLTGGAP